MKKRLFGVCFILCMVLMFTFSLHASAEILKSGTCGENLEWGIEEDLLYIVGTGAMTDWTSAEEVPWHDIKDSVKGIGIGEDVTSIGAYAFYDCSELVLLLASNKIESIGDHAFFGCVNLEYVSFGYNTEVTEENLGKVTFTEATTSIGNAAFQNCQKLKSISLSDSTKSIGDYAFADCFSLTTVTMENGVTEMGDCVFSQCISLKNVVLGEGLTKMGASPFAYCSSLTKLKLPNSLQKITSTTLGNCTELCSITIPTGITHISYAAFKDCKKLTDIYYLGRKEQWEKIKVEYDNDNLLNATVHFLKTVESTEILETEAGKLQVTVTLDEPVAQTIVMVATYDADGRFVGFVSQAVLTDSQTAVLEVEAKNASEVKTLLWQGMGTMAPLSVADTKTIE